LNQTVLEIVSYITFDNYMCFINSLAGMLSTKNINQLTIYTSVGHLV
jgi:hypothetical protein